MTDLSARREILYAVADDEHFDYWDAAFRKVAPDWRLVRPADCRDGAGIRHCLAWKPAPGTFARFPDLAVVFALAAGIERLLGDPELPPQVALVKMAEPGLTQTMTQYVLWQTIRHHRKFWELAEAQREARWFDQSYPPPWQRKVGVMGLGTLGTAAARALKDFQFDVRGWSRSPKTIGAVTCFAGSDALPAFLDGLDILVCLLPRTPETSGILNADVFRRLKPGAAIVNAGRGSQLNEADLLAALESGQLAAASLDVTAVEPLPPGHPFWRHPRIFLTPHNAAEIDPETAAATVARQIARRDAGEALEHAVDRTRGY